jgi:hypothetical protein
MKANLIKEIKQEVELARGQIFEYFDGDRYLLATPKDEEWVLVNLYTGKRWIASTSIIKIKEELEHNNFTFVGNLSDFELVKKEV